MEHTNQPANAAQQHARPDSIEEAIAAINRGTVQVRQISWQPLLSQMLSAVWLMTKYHTPLLWLQAFVGQIVIYNYRIDVLHQLQDVAPQCFDTADESGVFVQDCQYLCRIYRRLIELSIQGKTVQPLWNDNPLFNEFAVIMQDIRPEEMVAFSQSVLDRGNNTETTHSLFLYISRLYKYEDCLYTDDICEFCKGLYAAEGFRQYLMSGEKDYCNIADIHTLPLRLRNDCFDVYIRLCTDRITKDLELDNARLYPPTELEGMQSLLKQCTYSVNRMAGLKQFENSYAYARLWYPGADDVLAMATLFLRYLQDKIQLKTKSPDSSVVAHYYVNGDYVAGSKQVGTHIDNVATGGIGVQNNTTTQPE